MMISNKQVNDILKTHNLPVNKANGASLETRKTGKRLGNDQLAISEASKMHSVGLNALAQLPDVRWEKVEPIARQVATGTYTVSDGEVAEKMIGRLLVDEFI